VSADGYVMILAAVFILVVIFLPKGIAGLFEMATKMKPSSPFKGRLASGHVGIQTTTTMGEGDVPPERPVGGSHG
jgi:hypothetical protein